MLILCRRGPEASPEDEPTQAVSPPAPTIPAWSLEDSLCHLENVLGAPQCDLHHTSAFYIHSFLGTFSAENEGTLHCKTPLVQLLAAGVKCGLKSRAGKTNFYEV